MYWNKLDKVDSNLYKGLAILMIVMHNFMHLFPSPKENEFEFHPNRFLDLIDIIANDPESIIRVSLSFFGHFGVQIFIFLSAYGLSKKYTLNNLVYPSYILERFSKIYPAFILAILSWLCIVGWVSDWHGLLGPLKALYWSYESLALKMLLISNFIPGQSLSPVGPWWFIPFIFQFYFTFPLFLYIYSRWRGAGLLTISIASISLTAFLGGEIFGVNVYFTILAHTPELCLGVYLAKSDEKKIRFPIALLFSAVFLYLLGNVYAAFWYVSHISFLIILLWAFSYFIPKIKKNHPLKKVFIFFGVISMQLFLVNGFLREPFISWARDNDFWVLTLVLCLTSLTISLLMSLTLLKIENKIRKYKSTWNYKR